MDALRATSTPYFLAALVAAMGWLFDQSVERLNSVPFLLYSTHIVEGPDRDQFWITLQNNSVSASLSSLQLLVRCPNDTECLLPKAKPAENNRNFAFVPVPPVSLPIRSVDDSNAVFSQVQVDFMPPNTSASIRYSIGSHAAQPTLLFQFPESSKNISVFKDRSLAAWMAHNYYVLVFLAFVLTALATVGYLGWLLLGRNQP